MAFHPSGNAALKNSMTWYRNLYEPLLDLGHEVYLLRMDLAAKELGVDRRSKTFKAIFSQRLLETFKRENDLKPFDLFFSYFTNSDIEASCIDEIKKAGLITANFSCNNIHQFYLTRNIALHFDYNLHSEKHAAEKFRVIGANPVWFPMAANPKYYHPIEGLSREIDVSFVGQSYARRSYYMWYLLENGIDVQVYGPAWRQEEGLEPLRKLVRKARRAKLLIEYLFSNSPEKKAELSSRMAAADFERRLLWKYNNNLHFPISDEEMIRKYSESKISLGFLEVYNKHNPSTLIMQHLHLREFEAPMSGALYFTNYCDELIEFYEPDKEVVVYKNEYELLDKVRYFLSHPNEAEKIRQAGYRRALSCHTYHKRFEDLFKSLGF